MKNALLYFLFLCPAVAMANLQVFPTRVLLTESSTSTHLTIRNKSDKASSYKIKVVFYEMKADGSMKLVENPKAFPESATEFIRYAPKTVQLRPEEEQVVRLLSINSAGLKDGEYRAHLYFESMDSLDDTPTIAMGAGSQFFLKARLAVAIPVIIRKGQAQAQAQIKNLKLIKLPDSKWGFSFQLLRTGSGNLYGDLHLNVIQPGGQQVEVGVINGLSSYVDERVVEFALNEQKEEILKSGILKVEYRQTASDGGALLSSAESNPSPAKGANNSRSQEDSLVTRENAVLIEEWAEGETNPRSLLELQREARSALERANPWFAEILHGSANNNSILQELQTQILSGVSFRNNGGTSETTLQ